MAQVDEKPNDSADKQSEASQTSQASQASQVTIWERMEKPAKAPRTTLTHAAIAAAAVEIADADSLDAVSMRKLSGHLGVTTMALYRYVANKEELFELMLDEAYVKYRNPAVPGETWRDVMRVHAHQMRAIALRHPGRSNSRCAASSASPRASWRAWSAHWPHSTDWAWTSTQWPMRSTPSCRTCAAPSPTKSGTSSC